MIAFAIDKTYSLISFCQLSLRLPAWSGTTKLIFVSPKFNTRAHQLATLSVHVTHQDTVRPLSFQRITHLLLEKS